MRIIHSLKDALDFSGSYRDSSVENTLDYIFNHLHHNCYMLKDSELVKFEHNSSPPSARKTLKNKLVKNAKTMRVMNCVIKQFNKTVTTSTPYQNFISKLNLPKQICILNLTDALMLRKDRKEPWAILGDDLIPEKYRSQPFMKIYSGSGGIEYEDIPIPNYDDILIANGTDKIEDAELNWDQKEPIVIFRGSSTGCGIKPDTNMRLKIAKMTEPWLDAGITKMTTQLKFDPKYGLGYIKSSDVKKASPKSFTEQSGYKYIVFIDGNVAAFRMLKWFMTGSLCLRVQSNFTLWYDDLIKDGKHYIAVKSDLSDLKEKYEWCLKHDKTCKKIAGNAYKFAQKYLTTPMISKVFLQKLSAKS